MRNHVIMILFTMTYSSTITFAQSSPTPKETPELLEQGKSAFNANCAPCHGAKGDADTPVAKKFKSKPRSFISDKFKVGDTVKQIFETTTKGLPGTAMVGWPHIPEETRWAIAHYIKSLQINAIKK